MTKSGHRLTSLIFSSLLVYSHHTYLFLSTGVLDFTFAPNYLIFIFSAFAFSSFPDRAEILHIPFLIKKRLIRHRTYTHILAFWVAVWLFMAETILFKDSSYYLFAIFGLVSASLMHVLADSLTPMGIPVFTPNTRYSLNICKTKLQENLIVIAFFILAVTISFKLPFIISSLNLLQLRG